MRIGSRGKVIDSRFENYKQQVLGPFHLVEMK
jgi:hypothetical protein